MIKELLKNEYNISEQIIEFVSHQEKNIYSVLAETDALGSYHQYRVIRAMQEAKLSDRHFHPASGYGYDDIGREIVEQIFARVFSGEDALVRPHFTSGTHAIAACLYGILRPYDELIAVSGAPYDTIQGVIGYTDNKKSTGTLKDFLVQYKEIPLSESGSLQTQKIIDSITEKTRMIYLQRSTGYSWRKAITIEEMSELFRKVKEKKSDVVIMIDNCYGEFLHKEEPLAIGADIIAGSLIKNPGGGIAPTGGYIAGRKDLVYLAAERLAAPGVAKETGATLHVNRSFLQGLFLAPVITANALKTAILMGQVYKALDFEVCPLPDDYRNDIIQGIKLNNPDALEIFCQAAQEAAPVDAFVKPVPWDMPGYDDPVIMAAGAFIQGSSIELSADGPMREPYIGYFQGGLTHAHGKLGIYLTLQRLYEAGLIQL
jgi:cystathionine beta-lyase family protein involved in aluminum resistance